MAVVVTGGAGFIGGRLAGRLAAAGHDVVTVDRRAGADLVTDLSDPADEAVDALRAADVVFHLAGAGGVRPDGPDAEWRWWRDNVLAMEQVCAAVPLTVPMVVTSSSSVYGGAHLGRPSRETDALRPRGGYARAKVAVESIGAGRVARGGALVVARPFTVAGPGQRPDMAVSRWLAAARAGEPLQVFGGLGRRRDITDVDDICRGLAALAEQAPGTTVNLGTGRPQTLGALVQAVLAVTGSTSPVVVVPAGDEEVENTWADTARCRALLGFVPATDLVALVRRQAAPVPLPLAVPA